MSSEKCVDTCIRFVERYKVCGTQGMCEVYVCACVCVCMCVCACACVCIVHGPHSTDKFGYASISDRHTKQ